MLKYFEEEGESFARKMPEAAVDGGIASVFSMNRYAAWIAELCAYHMDNGRASWRTHDWNDCSCCIVFSVRAH